MAAARAIRSLYGGGLALGRRRYGGAMADEPVQGVTFQHRMSDFEALMWNVEKDPWLNPNGGVVVVCDRPPDFEDFRRRIAHAVAEIPRLRERVVPGVGRLPPPRWAPDPEFDLDNHLRHVALPAPGTLRQLYDLAARLMQDPFDRTRPLWLFVIVDGLEGGRGAMFAKLHHTIADGYAALRLAELYLTLERDAPPPPDVDLDRVVRESVDEDRAATERRRARRRSARLPSRRRVISGAANSDGPVVPPARSSSGEPILGVRWTWRRGRWRRSDRCGARWVPAAGFREGHRCGDGGAGIATST